MTKYFKRVMLDIFVMTPFHFLSSAKNGFIWETLNPQKKIFDKSWNNDLCFITLFYISIYVVYPSFGTLSKIIGKIIWNFPYLGGF